MNAHAQQNTRVMIALGSNIGFAGQSSVTILAKAIAVLEKALCLTAKSRLFQSTAWPDPADPPFVNAVVAGLSGYSAQQTLSLLHTIEASFGRRRQRRNAPRTLDLDLLDFGGLVVPPAPSHAGAMSRKRALELPHPAIASRDFVLAPLCDIAPEWRHPVTGISARTMLRALDQGSATPLDP